MPSKKRPRDLKTLKTKHFAPENWADFARGFAAKGEREAMRQHLLDGCHRCQEALEFWRTVSQFAAREAAYSPPADAVRVARGQLGMALAVPVIAGVSKLAGVIFDSFRQPALSGIRSVGKKPRQVVYQVGDYYLDVRIESGAGTEKVTCTGQIRDSSDPEKRMRDTPVLLLRGQDRIARTTTNPFGEFHLEFERQQNMWLAIGIQDEVGIVVPLERALEVDSVEARR
jgi:hypothetical protein